MLHMSPSYLRIVGNTDNFSSDNPNDNCEQITDSFFKIANKHAPLKMKLLRDNQ